MIRAQHMAGQAVNLGGMPVEDRGERLGLGARQLDQRRVAGTGLAPASPLMIMKDFP
jgi:hypothetical protein